MADRIYYSPRNGEEMLKACPPGTKIYMYSDLAQSPLPADQLILSLPENALILLQDPNNMNSGHWTGLSRHPEKREIYYFSSYGGLPDREKMAWTSEKELNLSGQKRNVLNDGLKELTKQGWTVHYNDKKFQQEGDKTSTCGIWTAAFLNSRKNPDEFAAEHRKCMDYYYTYFA